ncbi:hypothetical protein [Parvibium lacunae]|uniref:Uncharacterized protein n=1 Tax=Parvibium lacunae TaxID=1888893 RepID=A0A368KZL1_9BURK|nr:hypothetical protein [Parvibium lacunae]RCS56748.1 hypothetical protein DU000_10375 [Parvibium lacunae]
MADALANGKEVTLHEQRITVSITDANGTTTSSPTAGYVIFDPDYSSQAWMIENGQNSAWIMIVLALIVLWIGIYLMLLPVFIALVAYLNVIFVFIAWHVTAAVDPIHGPRPCQGNHSESSVGVISAAFVAAFVIVGVVGTPLLIVEGLAFISFAIFNALIS